MGVHIQVLRHLAAARLSLVAPLLLAFATGASFALGQAAAPPAGQPPNPQPVLPLGDVPVPAGASGVGVVPGGVARWAGEGITRCGDARETWQPLDGACYYPVDLGQDEGTLEVYRETAGRRETAKLRILPPPYAEESLRVDPRKVRLSKKDRVRADRERKVVVPLFSLRTNPVFSFPLGSPLRNAPTPRNFGKRRLFNGEPRSAHGGTDYRAPTGTPVLAAEAGLVVLAGLQGIPSEVLEAARVDGAGTFQRFRYITLPLLIPSLVVATLFRAIQSWGAFDIVYVMTGGGPGGSTETLALYAYQSWFRYLDFGYGAAIAVQGMLLALLLAAVVVRLASRREVE